MLLVVKPDWRLLKQAGAAISFIKLMKGLGEKNKTFSDLLASLQTPLVLRIQNFLQLLSLITNQSNIYLRQSHELFCLWGGRAQTLYS